MPTLPEEVGRGQPGRARAHHRHGLACFGPGRPVEVVGVFQRIVAQVALDVADRHRLVEVEPVAFFLAIVRARPAHDGRQRIGPQQDRHRFFQLAGAEFGHVRGDVIVDGAAGHARRGADAHAAEDRVVAVLGEQRVAPPAALAQAVEGVVRVAVIPAARLLAEVAGDRRDVANLRRGHAGRGFGEERIGLADRRVFRNLAERGERADPHTGRRRFHVAQRRHRLEADHQFRRVVVDGVLERPE